MREESVSPTTRLARPADRPDRDATRYRRKRGRCVERNAQHVPRALLSFAAGAAQVLVGSDCAFAAVRVATDEATPLVVQRSGDHAPPLRLVEEALRATGDSDSVWHFETTRADGLLPNAAAQAGFRSVVVVPLNGAGVRGCIAVLDRRTGRFHVSAMPALRRVARLTEIAIDDANAERRALARDLHDGFAQTLTGLVFATDVVERACDDAEQRRRVQTLRSCSVKAISEARELVDLVANGRRSVADPGEGFVARLRELASDGGVTRCTVGVEVLSLPISAQTCLFRVAQEALLN